MIVGIGPDCPTKLSDKLVNLQHELSKTYKTPIPLKPASLPPKPKAPLQSPDRSPLASLALCGSSKPETAPLISTPPPAATPEQTPFDMTQLTDKLTELDEPLQQSITSLLTTLTDYDGDEFNDFLTTIAESPAIDTEALPALLEELDEAADELDDLDLQEMISEQMNDMRAMLPETGISFR